MAPPSCSASWPASLVEWVAPGPGTSGQSGSTKTPTKPGNPGAGKSAPGSGKKTQPIQQAAGMFWGDKKREKEDADAQAQEERHRKKPSGPILSLDEHEHSITELTNRATPSQSTQPSKTSSSTPKDRVRPRKDPVAVPIRPTMSPCQIKPMNLKQRPASGIPHRSWSLWKMTTALPSPESRRLPRSHHQWRRRLPTNSYSASRARPELCSTIWSYLP